MTKRWVVAVVVIGSSALAQDGGVDCESLLSRTMRGLNSKKARAALETLEKAPSACASRHGFLAARGSAHASLGEFELASELFLKELREPDPTWVAVKGLAAVIPSVSPAAREKIAAAGGKPDDILYVPGHQSFAVLVEEVFCRDQLVVGTNTTPSTKVHAWVANLECPAGTRFQKFVRFDAREDLQDLKQAGPRRAVERMIKTGKLESKFGISTAFDLYEALRSRRTDRSAGWLLSWMSDGPGEKKLLQGLLKEDPDDLSSIITLASLQLSEGDNEGALKTTRAAKLDRVAIRDARGADASPSGLFSRQCLALRKQNKLKEAEAACRKSLELGSRVNGPAFFGEVLYLNGRYAEAIEQLEATLAADPRNRRSVIVLALALQELGQTEQAAQRFEKSWGLAEVLEAKLTDKRTRAQWIKALDRLDALGVAASLAHCGHLYLDLEMKEQSDVCFAAAKKIDVQAPELARLEHLAETDPSTAVKGLEAELKKARSAEGFAMLARAQAAAGDHVAAVTALRSALYLLPPWELPDELVATVCGEEALPTCLKAAPPP